jgi:spermidine/putrescine transport system ATP-binding protein
MQLELKALQREVGITFVYVTHDQEEALTMSDVIVVMRDGLIQQLGGPSELYERPVNRFVADFIGSSNFMSGTVESIGREGGQVVVRTDRDLALRGWVTDPSASLAKGQAVTVVTRPERLEVVPQGTDGAVEGWTSVPGRIHQGTYLGDQTEFRVQTDGAGELIVRRQNAMGAGAGQGLGPGDPVTVRWREEANLVLVG